MLKLWYAEMFRKHLYLWVAFLIAWVNGLQAQTALPINDQTALTIEVRNNFLQTYQQTNEFTSSNSQRRALYDRKVSAHSLDLLVSLNTRSKLFHQLRFGYQYSAISTADEVLSNAGLVERINASSLGWGARIGYGFGREIILDRLLFRPGIEAFTHLNMTYTLDYESVSLDTTGAVLGSYKVATSEPGQKSVGIGLFMSVYYRAWKGLSVGLNYSALFQYAFRAGVETNTFRFFDANGNEIPNDGYVRSSEINLKAFSSLFQNFSVSIRYNIPMRKKSE